MTATAEPKAATEVLDFWFGPPAERGTVRDAWFRKSDAFDREIDQRFGLRVAEALEGGLADWAASPRSSLARIVLLDQFTRNIFRDTPRAFAGDGLALAAAQALVASGQDATLEPLQRMFVYLPFEHAESLPMQEESVRLFTALGADRPELASVVDFAHRHHAVVARFGRFPHRNAILGRPSTEEEQQFLQQPGSRF